MTTLYRFFDADDVLLYVGIAGNPGRRFNEHNKDKDWWSQVARSTMEHHPDRHAALEAERLAIIAERPLHNVVHNTGQPPTTSPVRTFFCRWICFECEREIAGGQGYIQVDTKAGLRGIQANWSALHRACDPATDSIVYWVAVERIRSRSDLFEWDRHLTSKRWMEHTNWWEIVSIQDSQSGPFGPRNPTSSPVHNLGMNL